MSTTIAIIGAVLAVTSIASGIIQADAAKSAAAANAAVQREALALQQRNIDQARADQLPQIEIGQRAARTLAGTATDEPGEGGAEGLGLDRTFEDERADFLVDEGARAINRRLSALGQSFSGAALEAIARNTTDIRTASTQREVDLLGNLAGLGTTSSQGVAQTTAAIGQQQSSSLASIGSQNAAGILDAGAALGGGIEGIGEGAAVFGALGVLGGGFD